MNYSDYCRNFYFGRRTSGITGCKSEAKIAEYFLRNVLEDTLTEEILPTSESTYQKYFSGSRRPEASVWEAVLDVYDETVFSARLVSHLNAGTIERVAENFDLQCGDEPLNKEFFATALAKQFHAIANGNGNAANRMSSAYREAMRPKKFPEYIRKASDKYSRMDTLTGGSRIRLLKDYHVCNIISMSTNPSGMYGRGSRSMIKDATAEKIGAVSNRIILVGNGGSGKTLMLQRLFVDSAEKYVNTGVMPIMVTLRDFRYNDKNLLLNIVRSVQRFEPAFTETDAHKLMAAGGCRLLLDGADEIDPDDVTEFQRQLSETLDRYSDVQVVITSRECETIRAFHSFGFMYLMPFEKEQSLELIGKILSGPEDHGTKEEIISLMEKGFLKQHHQFLSNPMLLTFIITKHPMLRSFYGECYQFYKTAYEAIVTGHDEEKIAYDRIFRSAADAEEFTMVFREFCAKSYRQCVFEFDKAAFEKFFNTLKSKERLSNPGIMKKKSFIHDACVTTCMMYEEQLKMLYLDRGFQEFLFAEYYYLDERDQVEKMGRSLWHVPMNSFGGSGAFKMLYDCSPDKVEICLFLPFLREIFENKSEDEAYESFLAGGYSRIEVSALDEELIKTYERQRQAKGRFRHSGVNEPSTVILSFMLEVLGEPQDFRICLPDEIPDKESVTSVIVGEMGYDPQTREDIISMRRLKQKDVDNWETYARTHYVEKCVMDEKGTVVCFGYEYSFGFRDRQQKRLAAYAALLAALQDENSTIRKTYHKVRDYYDRLLRRHFDDGDNNF